MSRVGEKIKEARLKGGISQKNLAKKLGVAEKYINDIELGRKVAQESFIDRASKVLGVDLNDISMVVTDEALMQDREEENLLKKNMVSKTSKKEAPKEEWATAFASVLKKVPIYASDLKKVIGYREMAIHSNKIEGFPQDKVIYYKIGTDEMIGFKMNEGDTLFGHMVNEVTVSGFYLIESKGKLILRQIRKLDKQKALLISNRTSVITETVEMKSIKPLAKFIKLEIAL